MLQVNSLRPAALRVLVPGLIGLVACVSLGAPARADISFVDAFRSNAYQQVGDGNTLNSLGSFFSSQLFSTVANEFDSVQLTYPGAGSPVGLSPSDPTTYLYQLALFPNQAAMDAAFPTGTYTFDATNPSGTQTATLEYRADAYPQSLPYLTGT